MTRALALALALVAVSATARADEPKPDRKSDQKRATKSEADTDLAREVDEHLQRGIEFYAEKQYELALVEFRAGYALDPRPDFLFAMAQAERLSGDCPTAVVYYQRFLETHPDPNQAEAARVNLRRCNRALESGPGGRPRVPTPQALDEAEQASEPPAPIHAPAAALTTGPGRDRADWYRDVAGGAMAGGSVAALGVSIGFWVAKGSAERASSESSNYFDYLDATNRASRDRTVSLVALGVGAALAAGATYRYLTVKRRGGRVRLALTPTGFSLAVAMY